jgi:transposase
MTTYGTSCRDRRVFGELSYCVVVATGRIVREAKVASEPEDLIIWFRSLGHPDRAEGWTFVAMALRCDEESGSFGRVVGDAKRARRLQGDAG